jgi:hypothetical protein
MFVNAQEAIGDDVAAGKCDTAYMIAHEMPEFTEGDLFRWLIKNISIDQAASESEGYCSTAYVSFTVDKKGNVINVHVPSPRCAWLEKEVIRAIGKMPQWKPGILNGQPVCVSFTIPVRVHLK